MSLAAVTGLLLTRHPGRTTFRLSRPSVSGVLRPRALAVSGGLVLAALVVFCVNIGQGEYGIPLLEVLRTLVGAGAPDTTFVVIELRLPRSLTGLLVGAAFGLSGAIFQSLARNPLASPDIIGITAGASAAAVLVIVIGVGGIGTSAASLIGGLLAALAVYALAWRKGASGYRLVLVGIGIGAMLSSVISYLLIRAELTQATQATVWLTGSLNGRGWEHVRPVGLALLVLLPIALLLGRSLSTLRLGDDVARALGTRVHRARIALVLVAVGLAAVGTASAGPVAFVGLVAPQVALRLAGTPGIPLAASAACGALLVVTADLVGRTALGLLLGTPTELPVGAVTALVGAPVLLWLLRRTVRGSTA